LDNRSYGHRSFFRQIGSVNSDSNLIVRLNVDQNQIGPAKQLPFQIQISYTRLDDGKQLHRVISAMMPICQDRTLVESRADPEAIALCALRSVAQHALQGAFTVARLENYSYLQLMKRLAKVSLNADEAKEVLGNYLTHHRRLEALLYSEQVIEIKKNLQWDETSNLPEYNDFSENLEDGLLASLANSVYSWWNSTPTPEPLKEEVKQQNLDNSILVQRAKRSDEVSNLLWNMRSANML